MVLISSIASSFDSLISSSPSISTASTAQISPTSFYFELAITSFNSVDNTKNSLLVQSTSETAESPNSKYKSLHLNSLMELDLDADDYHFDSNSQLPITSSKNYLPLLKNVNFVSKFSERLIEENLFSRSRFSKGNNCH